MPAERSVSPSGQFVIYGGDAAWRGAISALAEQTKANLLTVLQRRDEWVIPAVLNLQEREANLPEIPNAALRFSQTGSGLKLQLDLTISREMNSSAVEHQILRVILLEMIYRNQTGIASGETYVEPPAWLVDGLLALMPNRNRTALIDALGASDKAMSLDDFLRQRLDLLDQVGQSVYRANSFALVQLLAKNPAQLGRFIDNFASSSNDPLADLQKGFPQLRGDVETIWKSKIASLKESDRTDLLTFSKTNERLDALLQTKFPTADGHETSLSLDDLCQKRKLSSAQKLALKNFAEDLMRLAERSNPALRPIVQDYRRLVLELALGKSHGLVKFAGLKDLRTRLSARMTEVDDYMNWFEATQLQTSSGLFENLNTAGETSLLRPHRRDSFSIYLDAMESDF